jgi:hypothetical protein
MMPMPMRRKARKLEKVKNLSRTARAQKILPTGRNKQAGINWITPAQFRVNPGPSLRG